MRTGWMPVCTGIPDSEDEIWSNDIFDEKFSDIDNRTLYLMSGRTADVAEHQRIRGLHERLEFVRM